MTIIHIESTSGFYRFLLVFTRFLALTPLCNRRKLFSSIETVQRSSSFVKYKDDKYMSLGPECVLNEM